MQAGAITNYVDVAQIAWWAFFGFFIGLVLYLRREDQREGYPKHNLGLPPLAGPPILPPPRTYLRQDGSTTEAPHHDPDPPVRAEPLFRFPGGPLMPVGNKLTAAVGPGTYAMRRDEPFRMTDETPQVQPLRVAAGWSVMAGETDPRGMPVLDIRFRPVGVVRDLWVDRGVKVLRYFEVELDQEEGVGRILLPIHHCVIDERKRRIRVLALHHGQFADVPRLKSSDQITAREEDQINGYYAGGRFHRSDISKALP